ncbi:MAG: sulfurtransferase [Desulfurivibrionaceae bacterium]|nr:sulfurtransferase [Pseudomonadota bacterium]MCG2823962.1 sulfurtransferase [Desulfobulbaceae bacterium]MDP2001830.1 sulfurtransferase [Desulfurivibrionaceae bacterium]PKN22113.1 MAG: hypothetical protein CVU68_05240 [Deltaproteobacteria bacterium HGW-Deltaproteobacteria-3]MBU4411549.1 sulfurtransferase [Pseudomonadota bacterium]
MKIMRALLGVLLVLVVFAGPAAAIDIVEADWVKQHINDPNIRVVEVPSKAEAIAGDHLPGNKHLPNVAVVNRYLDLGNVYAIPPTLYPTKDQFENLMARLGITNDTTVVAYDDKYSIFASRLLVVMEHYGHDTSKLKLLNGGLVKWKKLGYPLVDGHGTIKPARYTVVKMNPNVITWSDVYRDTVAEKNPKIVLLDVRPADEYNAKEIRSIRGGHIPGAVNVTGTLANNTEDHTFKSAEEIGKIFAEAGVTPDKVIYQYCHSGDRTAHAYIVLKNLLGFKDIKVYPGSWSEWSTILSLPVENEVWYSEKQQSNAKK